MHHMTYEERLYLERRLKPKDKVARIAEDLGYSTVTIYAEIKRGKCLQRNSNYEEVEVYLADVGQRKHDEAMRNAGRPTKLSKDCDILREFKYWIINMKYSPEAFVMKTRMQDVCVRTLYNYVYKQYINGMTVTNLPYAKPKKKKKPETTKRPFKSRGTSIEERPDIVNLRQEYGHWEIDTVYSSHDDLTCLLTLTERKAREEIVMQIKDRTSASIIHSLNRLERTLGAPAFRKKFKSITCDNGSEFSDCAALEKSCINKGPRTKFYYCHPYCSSERGTNENYNRMIRRWIPKGDDIGLYSPEEIQFIQYWINTYPRKMFGGLSSSEYLHQLLYTN